MMTERRLANETPQQKASIADEKFLDFKII
jgi:hypothetical protein